MHHAVNIVLPSAISTVSQWPWYSFSVPRAMTTCRVVSVEMSTIGMEIVRKVPGVGPENAGASAAWTKALHENASKQERDRSDMVRENGGGEGI
jgi:hypothetical protein